MAKDSYKDLKEKLDQVVMKLQDPDTDLDEALQLHAEGKKLLSRLEAYLADVEAKIANATTSKD